MEFCRCKNWWYNTVCMHHGKYWQMYTMCVMPWEYYDFAKGVYTMDNDNGTWVSRSAGLNFSNDFVMYAAMAENDITTIYLGGHDNNLSAPLVYKSADAGITWNKVFNTTNNANIITGWEGAGGDKAWSWSETCFGITVAPGNVQQGTVRKLQ